MVKFNSTIFRTITDEVTGATKSIGLFGKSFAELKETLNSVRTNGLFKTSVLSESDVKCIEKYNNAIALNIPHQQAMEQATKGASSSTAQMIKNANGNTIALDKMTLGAKASSVAMKGLAIAGNMVASMLISWVISSVVTAIDNYIHRLENAREKLTETESELESVNSEIEKINAQIIAINSKENLSITDKDDLEELRKQNEELRIRQKYLEQERQQKAQDTADIAKEEYESKYGSAITRESINKEGKYVVTGESAAPKQFSGAGSATQSQYYVGYEVSPDNTAALIAQYEKYEELKADAIKDEDTQKIEDYNTKLQETADKLREDRTELQGYADDCEKAGDTSSQTYKDIVSDLNLIDSTLFSKSDNLVSFLNSDKLVGDKQNLTELANSGKLTADVLKSKFSEVNDYLIENGLTLEDLISIVKIYNEELGTTNSTSTSAYAKSDAIKSQIGDLESRLETIQYLKGLYGDSDSYYNKMLEENESSIESQISDLQTKLHTQLVKDKNKAFKNGWSALDTTEDENLKDLKSNLTELAEAGKLTVDVFGDTDGASAWAESIGLSAEEATKKVNALIDSSKPLASLKSLIGSIQAAYQEKEENGVVGADTLSGMEDTFGDLKYWEQYKQILGSTTSSLEDCRKAQNKLATQYVNSKNFLSQLTEENKDYYKSQLKEMGVSNAGDVVESALEQKYGALNELQSINLSSTSQAAQNASKSFDNLENASADTLLELADVGEVSEITRTYLLKLAMVNIDWDGINPGEAISKLESITEAAGITIATIGVAKEAYSNLVNHEFQNPFTNGVNNDLLNPFQQAYTKGENTETYDLPSLIEQSVTDTNNALGDLYSKIKIGDLDIGGDNDRDGSGGSSSKQQFDWIERRVTVLTNKISKLNAQKENLFTVKKKNNNLDAQIKETTKLINTYDKAYSKYMKKANSISFSKDKKKDSAFKKKIQNGQIKGNYKDLIKEYGETTASKIQAYMDWWDKAQSSKQSEAEARTQKRQLKIEKNQNKVDKYDAKADYNDLRANDTSLSAKKRNKYLNYEKNNLKESYKYQIKIANLEGKKTEAKRLQEELDQKLVELSKQQFDNVAQQYERQVQMIGYTISNLDNQIAEIEASGRKVNISLYNSKKAENDNTKARYEAELKALQSQLSTIKQGTDEWYDAQDAIQECKNSISECVQTTYELNNAINELHFERFNDIAEGIQRIVDEQDFLQGLFAHENLTDDETGKLTEAGLGKLGSLATQYYSSQGNASYSETLLRELEAVKKYGKQLNGIYSYGGYIFNSLDDLEAKINETYSTWQNNIQETYSVQTEIADLMKEQYQSELDMLKELIEARKEELQFAEDLRQYNREITEKTNNISLLQRQIAAYGGDSSEEGKSRLQQLRAQLDEAQDDLAETENEKMVSDINDMLDKLVEEYEDLITDKLEDFMSLVQEGLTTANDNSAIANAYLSAIAKSNGYDIRYEDLLKDGNIQGNVNNTIKGIEEGITSSSGIGAQLKQSKIDALNGTASKSPLALRETAISYIKDNAVTASNSKDQSWSDVNQVLFENKANAYSGKGKVLTDTNLKTLARLLGVSTYDFSKSGELYKKMKEIAFPGFSKGGIVSVDDITKQVRNNGDSVLVSANPGEGFLTKENVIQINDLLDFVPQLTNFAQNLTKLPVPNRDVGSTFNGDVSLNLELPNVHNANDFVYELQNNPKVRKAVQSVTTDMLAGGGRLSVRNIK